jgi:hypothetical protein
LILIPDVAISVWIVSEEPLAPLIVLLPAWEVSFLGLRDLNIEAFEIDKKYQISQREEREGEREREHGCKEEFIRNCTP